MANKGDQHTAFDHDFLAKLLKSRDVWVLSYNDCEEILDLYEGHHMITPSWAYGMNHSKKSTELLILSRDHGKMV